MGDPADVLAVLNAKRMPNRGLKKSLSLDLVPHIASIHVKSFTLYEPGTVISMHTLVLLPDAQ